MKEAKGWRLGNMGDIKIGSRPRPPLKRSIWMILTVSFASLLLLCAYLYLPNGNVACYAFSPRGCEALSDWLPPAPKRELTDEEVMSRVVVRDILNMPPVHSKIALTPGSLPFEKHWDMFFRISTGGNDITFGGSKHLGSCLCYLRTSTEYYGTHARLFVLDAKESLDQETHITSNDKGDELLQPCLWNGIRRPCFLFARKFYPETSDKLATLLNL
ncbi:putative Eukaryotic aspartyl protease family protein [Hibiscus syriacus]|uniref:Eukaryotic aspartyl protease family protein n=1 Tax=Hibiscus syriacus TaxID=106335 RepID=A0A6A2WY94_HIBSY|nr:putative Eukaryotic aspartyl protease family protein [Hibiscus syriacus]